MRNRLAVTTAAIAAGAVFTLSSAAYACVVFRGHGDIVGNASTVHSVVEGNNVTMGYCLLKPGAQAHSNGGTVTIAMSTAKCNGSHLTPNALFDVRYFNGVGFKTKGGVYGWFTDCMEGGPGVSLGHVGTDSAGSVAATKFALGSGITNVTGQDSAVCLSDTSGIIGIEIPVHIVV